jgi:hypothetical protein
MPMGRGGAQINSLIDLMQPAAPADPSMNFGVDPIDLAIRNAARITPTPSTMPPMANVGRGTTGQATPVTPAMPTALPWPEANMSGGPGYRDMNIGAVGRGPGRTGGRDLQNEALSPYSPSPGFLAANMGPQGFMTTRDFFHSRGSTVPPEFQQRAGALALFNPNLMPPAWRQQGMTHLLGGIPFGGPLHPGGGGENLGNWGLRGVSPYHVTGGFPAVYRSSLQAAPTYGGFPGQLLPWTQLEAKWE